MNDTETALDDLSYSPPLDDHSQQESVTIPPVSPGESCATPLSVSVRTWQGHGSENAHSRPPSAARRR